MQTDILIIGAGASGLMAAYGAADTLLEMGSSRQVCLVEKMPKAGRKIMITGKGRCNFSNFKDWNAFSAHVRSGSNLLKPAFFNLTPQKLQDFFESNGLPTVVERGDRAFPESRHAGDVVDCLLRACLGKGVKFLAECPVCGIEHLEDGRFLARFENGEQIFCSRLILATGGLSYPGSGSSGDGLRWARDCGHKTGQLFPSLTALVPKGYKLESDSFKPELPCHIHRQSPLSELGSKLCGTSLKNVGVQLYVQDTLVQEEFGDIDFTDGGIEGPAGFSVSRKAVKALVNGSKVKLVLDLKQPVSLTELTQRVKELWSEVDKDPRSRNLKEKEKCRILLGKLLPWELIPAFVACNPGIMTLERRSRTDTKLWINLPSIAKALKCWSFDIEGFVAWERAVVTAGGVSASDVVAKTLESRLVKGLHFCGEMLDIDCDTGGYNLHSAFATGLLAGQSAAKSLQ